MARSGSWGRLYRLEAHFTFTTMYVEKQENISCVLFEKIMLKLTIQNQHDEGIVDTSRYLFEVPTYFDSVTSLHQG